jgi:nucleotide-binding universal stress UspA family protein
VITPGRTKEETMSTTMTRPARLAAPKLSLDHPGQRRHVSRVVVGVDGSANSLAALRRAAAQARARKVALEVVHVLSADASERDVKAARLTLRTTVSRVCPGDFTGAPPRLRVERGDAAAVLLVVSAGADLLVIGARERCETGNLFDGPTVSRCADYAACPVDVCADQGGRTA